jgi:mycothiol synthase
VPPAESGAEVADSLLGAVEARATEIGSPSATVKTSVPSVDEVAAGCLRARGYERVRNSFQMRIELDGVLESPSWPEGIVVRAFEPGRDAEAVYEVQQETFADQFEYARQSYGEWRAHMFLGRHDPSLWLLAEDGAEIAGISLCRPHWAGNPDLGWVSVLGVRRRWRGRGLGLALLLRSFAELQARGRRSVGLGVDALNPTGAVRLYERAGMRVVRRSDQYLKSLGA